MTWRSRGQVRAPLLVSVALLSAAAIAVEILFMRLLSIALWHHFAYMVISLALLGYGASGTLLSVAGEGMLRRFDVLFPAAAALFGVAAPGAFSLAQAVPFSPLELAWNPRELLGLTAVYLLLSIPFLCAATAVGLALMRLPGRVGRVYAADLAGAGLGAAAVIGLLFVLPAGTALLALGGAGLVAAGLACLGTGGSGPRWPSSTAAAALALAAVALVLFWPRSLVEPRMSQFKGLPTALRVPGVEVVAERMSPLGLLTAIESRQVPLRHAPGLSLASTAEVPEQVGVFVDGDALAVIDRWPGGGGDLAAAAPPGYRDDLTSALPYHLTGPGARPRVLVLGAGGGVGVREALARGARSVDAVELDRRMVELVRGPFAAFSGRVYDRPGVAVHVAEARGFVAGTGRRWDLVEVSLLDSFGASAAGVHALSESHLYTVEALAQFLERLEPRGFLAITRWVEVPPRGSLKLFATAVEALERSGVKAAGERLAVVRSWKTATLVVKGEPFTPAEVAAVRGFAEERWFDLVWVPGMTRDEANRFNVWEAPYLHDGAVEILAGGERRARFLERYKFFVEPATDDRPYFFRFFKWRALGELLALRGRGGTHLIEWGYPVLVVTLAQALVCGLLLVVAPVVVLVRRRRRVGGGVGGRSGFGRIGLYFLCLGLGFLFLEIAFIQRFTLFLAHPLYAVAVVLAGFLVFAGVGSGVSGRLRGWAEGAAGLAGPAGPAGSAGLAGSVGWPRVVLDRVGVLGVAAVGVAVVAVVYAVVLPWLFAVGVGWSDGVRLVVALGLIAPLAVLMGMPFPLGLERLERVGRGRVGGVAWAWAVNGCASVVGAVLATLVAVHFGFTVVVLVAAGLYGAAAGVGRGL